MTKLLEHLAQTDIYLIDQILRGRIREGAHVIDAGCGRGRNLRWFAAQGHPVSGFDRDPVAVAETKAVVQALNPAMEESRFLVHALEDAPPAQADFAICNAVLHFAKNQTHFDSMVARLVGLLRPGGIGFVRLATLHALAEPPEMVEGKPAGWFHLRDGSERFLVSLQELLRQTSLHRLNLLDPVKTTNVQDLRAMSTWVFQAP